MSEVGNAHGAIFDREDLLRTVDGDTEIMDQLVGMFIDAVPEQMESIRTAIGQRNFSEAARQAHKLKGTAANLRALFLHVVYTELEDALKARDLPHAIESLTRCADGFGHFKEVFEHGARL